MTETQDVTVEEVYDVLSDSALAVVMVPSDDDGADIYTIDNTGDDTDPERVAVEMLAGMGVQMDLEETEDSTNE